MRIPVQYLFCLGRIAPEIVYIRRAKPLCIDGDENLSGSGIDASFVCTFSFPSQCDAVFLEGPFRKIADGVLLTGCNHEVVRTLLL